MIIQTMDIQDNCMGIFYEGSFYFDNYERIVEDCKLAWKHSPAFSEDQYTYLYLLLKGDSLAQFSPDTVRFTECEDKIRAQAKAARTAKIDIGSNCLFDVVPRNQLHKWYIERQNALKSLSKKEKSKDYEILHKIHVLATEIGARNVLFRGKKAKIKYDIFGSVTGRLVNTKDSVPVLTLKKENRDQLVPQNDLFLELDLNGAEIRTLLALSSTKQPSVDIHEWNLLNCARNLTTRKEMKERFFAWLYNPEAKDFMLEKFYDKGIYKDFYKDGRITTPFHRVIKVGERKALNYLIQSTTSDLVMETSYEIMKLLKFKKSFVAFTMHDSVVLDFSQSDINLVSTIKDVFELNRLGRFSSQIQIGKNFGEMKGVEI